VFFQAARVLTIPLCATSTSILESNDVVVVLLLEDIEIVKATRTENPTEFDVATDSCGPHAKVRLSNIVPIRHLGPD
jgi:hypothetical protein